MEQTGAPASETPAAPAPVPAGFSLRDYRHTKGETPTPAPATDPTAAETPETDPEDPELQAEVDKLEPPTPEETPAEKAARTRKHKEAARKGYQTRLANKASRLERENEDLRRQVQSPPAGRTDPARAPQPAPKAAESDPGDPEPAFEHWAKTHSFDEYAAKHPNHPDAYAGWQSEFTKDWHRWNQRQADRTAAAARAESEAKQRADTVGKRLDTHVDHGRGQYRDYDATLTALGSLLRGHPADEVLAERLADIDDPKVGGELLYRLGKDLDGLRAAVSRGRDALLEHIGLVKRDITAPAKAAAPAVSQAPAPHQPVAAAATGTPANPASKGGTSLSLSEKRKWDAAHGRRS